MISVVRDANIRLGERVALFGLGAIGFMVLQMARLSGAQHQENLCQNCGERG